MGNGEVAGRGRTVAGASTWRLRRAAPAVSGSRSRGATAHCGRARKAQPTRRSSLADASRPPSSLHASRLTHPLWPCSTASSCSLRARVSANAGRWGRGAGARARRGAAPSGAASAARRGEQRGAARPPGALPAGACRRPRPPAHPAGRQAPCALGIEEVSLHPAAQPSPNRSLYSRAMRPNVLLTSRARQIGREDGVKRVHSQSTPFNHARTARRARRRGPMAWRCAAPLAAAAAAPGHPPRARRPAGRAAAAPAASDGRCQWCARPAAHAHRHWRARPAAAASPHGEAPAPATPAVPPAAQPAAAPADPGREAGAPWPLLTERGAAFTPGAAFFRGESGQVRPRAARRCLVARAPPQRRPAAASRVAGAPRAPASPTPSPASRSSLFRARARRPTQARDLAVLAAAAYRRAHGRLRVLDAMAGSGVRAARYIAQAGADFVWWVGGQAGQALMGWRGGGGRQPLAVGAGPHRLTTAQPSTRRAAPPPLKEQRLQPQKHARTRVQHGGLDGRRRRAPACSQR
jgi:hypothetical protein